ncbi:MAG TPA: EAL domain-containing protein [Treponemataceae bacterium]|nr:EAL domain-containing protein [Treponemataceae bacterium]
MKSNVRVLEIMEKEQICTFFQPIISLKTGSVFAYEALVRGVLPDSPDLITPCELFSRAREETVSHEFDRLCRKKALEQFRSFHTTSTALLFMNINTAIIGTGDDMDSPHISTITRQMGFVPEHVGLELIESRAHSADDLITFVNRYRSSGFLIVIDDFGCEHSNIDRLIQIHPDIIKIDRTLISGIADDPYRQSIIKSIRSLAQMTGALCLAEGVETIDEIRACHVLGVDLFQGFAIACPSPDLETLEQHTRTRIREVQHSIRKDALDSLRIRRRLTGDIHILADWLIRQIRSTPLAELHNVFEEFIAINREIECVFLLDTSGIQISETICSPVLAAQEKPTMFSPAKKGADHSFKAFFACFEALGIQRYLTDVYLSLASGNLCRTFSVLINEHTDQNFILCIDFLEETIKPPYTLNAVS